jgi:hypothetical protein
VAAELLETEDLISESTRLAAAGCAVPLLAPAASTAGAGLLLGAEPSDATSVTPLGLKLVAGSGTGMPAAPGAFAAVSAVLEAPNFGAATDAVGFFGVLLGVAACTINKRDNQQHNCLYMASDPADGDMPTLDRLLKAHSTTWSVAACLVYLRLQLSSKAYERRIERETHLASLQLHALLHPEGCRSLSWSWTFSRTRLVTASAKSPAAPIEDVGRTGKELLMLLGKQRAPSRCTRAAFAPAGCGDTQFNVSKIGQAWHARMQPERMAKITNCVDCSVEA